MENPSLFCNNLSNIICIIAYFLARQSKTFNVRGARETIEPFGKENRGKLVLVELSEKKTKAIERKRGKTSVKIERMFTLFARESQKKRKTKEKLELFPALQTKNGHSSLCDLIA